MEEMNREDVPIERIIAEAELIRKREEKVGLESKLEEATQDLQNLKDKEKSNKKEIEEQVPDLEEK